MVEDSKTAVVNFLSTLVSKSIKLNVDFDTITGSGVKIQQPGLSANNSQIFAPTPSIKGESASKGRDEASNVCRFSLTKLQLGPYDVFLQRDFYEGSRYRSEEVE